MLVCSFLLSFSAIGMVFKKATWSHPLFHVSQIHILNGFYLPIPSTDTFTLFVGSPVFAFTGFKAYRAAAIERDFSGSHSRWMVRHVANGYAAPLVRVILMTNSVVHMFAYPNLKTLPLDTLRTNFAAHFFGKRCC